MAAKVVTFDFPLRGKHDGLGFEGQRPLTSTDMFNVRPFDAAGNRARGGRRPGVQKVNATALAGRVQALHQATLPSSAFIQGPRIFYFEGPALTNGAYNGGPGGFLTTVTTTADSPSGVSGTAGTTALQVFNGAAYPNVTSAQTVGVRASNGADNGQAFVSRLNATPPLDSAGKAWAFRVTHRVNEANPRTDQSQAVVAEVTKTTLRLLDGDGGVLASHTLLTPIARQPFQFGQIFLELEQAGDVFTAKVSGLAGVQETVTATRAGFTGTHDTFAFGIDGAGGAAGSTDSDDDAHVNEFSVYEGSVNPNARAVYLLAVANGNVYAGWDGPAGTLTLLAAGVCSPLDRVSIDDSGGKAYLCWGGAAPRVIDLRTRAIATHAAASGKGAIPAGVSLVCCWRDRVIYSGVEGEEQNVYASRSGDHTDYLHGQDDALSAFALNAGNRGRIGHAITAMVPFKDDVLLLGGDAQISACVGDPAAGGSVVTWSESVGISAHRAWTMSTEGACYFVGPGGFYRMAPGGGKPEALTADRLNETFRRIDRDQLSICVEWDRDLHGCSIFLTRLDQAQSTHYWFDARTGAFCPEQLPVPHGPTATCLFDGDAATDRKVIMGGFDGNLRQFHDDVASDDGLPINSHVLIGPVQPFGPYQQGILSGFEVVMSGDTDGVTMQLLSGPSAEEAAAADPQTLATWDEGGRRPRVLTRVRANTYFLKFVGGSDDYWALERAAAAADAGGMTR